MGAIGRQVALQLAAMGVPAMTLIDDDVVAIENLAVQGYRHGDLGQAKVTAAKAVIVELNPEVDVSAVLDRFRRSSGDTLDCLQPSSSKLAVFACVDAMAGRRIVWETTRSRAAFFADGRMAGETIRVLASADPVTDERYAGTLFDDAAAHPAPCTGRSTLYAASLAASLILHRFAVHLRALLVPADTRCNERTASTAGEASARSTSTSRRSSGGRPSCDGSRIISRAASKCRTTVFVGSA